VRVHQLHESLHVIHAAATAAAAVLCGCRYVGRLKSNGKVFDKTDKKPFAFRLGESLPTDSGRGSLVCTYMTAH
jgi:hypothetical protein